MIYINHNKAVEQLQNILDNSFTKEYMPTDFNQQQYHAFDLLKKRIFLEEVIEKTISFNRELNWENDNKHLRLVNDAENLIEVFKLRSTVLADVGYQEECPDVIEGLNFDTYDNNSAVLYYKNNNEVTGTLRLVFDSENKLPTDGKFSFNHLRKQYNTIGELSRFAIKNRSKGLSLEFKNLFAGVYDLFANNDIDLIVTSIKKEHFKMYSKFGGTEILQEMDNYGNIPHEAYTLLWDPSLASGFFKKAFLQ